MLAAQDRELVAHAIEIRVAAARGADFIAGGIDHLAIGYREAAEVLPDGKAEVVTFLQQGEASLVAILDGLSGKVKYTAPWTPLASDFQKSSTRVMLSVVCLDGKNPAVITQSGLYENEILTAYDQRLNQLWQFHSLAETSGSGGHKIEAADVDGDGDLDPVVVGREPEIVPGVDITLTEVGDLPSDLRLEGHGGRAPASGERAGDRQGRAQHLGNGRAPSGCRSGATFLVSVQRSAVSYQQKQVVTKPGRYRLIYWNNTNRHREAP